MIWPAGKVPVAVVMISLNEGHNMKEVLDNLTGWAQQVLLVDSYSTDDTVDIALRYGVHVVQRRFRGFGDQWNFALRELPITSPWTMKLDPDERLTPELKRSIEQEIEQGIADAISIQRRLWFMATPLPITQSLLRLWRTGTCRFTDVLVNEHPIVSGNVRSLREELEHRDSPDLHHWVEKQNRYTTTEALVRYRRLPLAAEPRLFGSTLERRMWFKRNFIKIPFRYQVNLVVNLIEVRAWRSGRVGAAWARHRVWARRMVEDKHREMLITRREIALPSPRVGEPHPGATCAD